MATPVALLDTSAANSESLDPIATDAAAKPELFPGDTTARTSMSRAAIEITDRRNRNNVFWAPPRGLRYGLLVGALPIQQPNLYPDENTTYFVAQFKLPPGASLTLRGEYGHLRYFSFAVASQLGDGQLGNGDFIRDNEIQPDEGSVNPFDQTGTRDVPRGNRRYTMHVVQGMPPKNREGRAMNTLYTSTDSAEAPIHLSIRNYVPDVGFDGTGNVRLDEKDRSGLPEVTLHLPDGREISEGEEMAKILRVTRRNNPAGFSEADWLELVQDSRDPRNAPAVPDVQFQRFWNTPYSVNGSFVQDPARRVELYPANNEGGFATNPDTVYQWAQFSLGFGQVAVIRAKMPRHARTRHGQTSWPQDSQLRYFSVSSSATAPSGAGWQSLFDEEIPTDDHGNFTLVMSWPEDRPSNAVKENGVAWIDFGAGEGRYVGARNWVNVLYFRYQDNSPGWRQSPSRIPVPTVENPVPQDAEVMQEYYPRAVYMSKQDFEALGPQGKR